jgi:hypothetical protein
VYLTALEPGAVSWASNETGNKKVIINNLKRTGNQMFYLLTEEIIRFV